MRRSRLLIASAALLALGAVSAVAQVGPPQGMIYANDQLYRTVGTPAVLPDHGSFNTIYVLGNGFANVSDAAPGDRNWRGGRWEVRPVTYLTTSPTPFTNAAQVQAAVQAGQIRIEDVKIRFECPLLHIPQH
jgi:hypothetical protein